MATILKCDCGIRKALAFLVTGLLLAACKPSDTGKRYYREVVLSKPKAPVQHAGGHHAGDGHDHSQEQELPPGHPPIASATGGMDANALPPSMRGGAGVDLAWDVPEGWSETAGQGMRRASFSFEGSDVLCTIVALGGMAGGMESNIRRWLGQVGIKLEGDAFGAYINSLETGKTASGLAWTLVDFNSLVSGDNAPSMKAAILDKDGSSVFVKLTGPAAGIAAREDGLRELVNSIR